MKNKICFAALLLLPALAIAQENTSLYGETFLLYARGKMGDSSITSNTYYLGGNVVLPFYKKFGVKVLAAAWNGSSDASSYEGQYFGTQAGFGVFARDSKIGKIELDWSHINSSNDYDFQSGEKIKFDDHGNNYALSGAYYLGPLTLAVSRQVDISQAFGSKQHTHSANFQVSGYPTDDLRVDVDADYDLGAEKDYSIGVEFQPEVFGQRASLLTNYTKVSGHFSGHSISLMLNYFWGDRVDLKTRDRSYR